MFKAPLSPSSGAQYLYRWLLPMVLGALVYRSLVWCGAVGCVSGLRDAARASRKQDSGSAVSYRSTMVGFRHDPGEWTNGRLDGRERLVPPNETRHLALTIIFVKLTVFKSDPLAGKALVTSTWFLRWRNHFVAFVGVDHVGIIQNFVRPDCLMCDVRGFVSSWILYHVYWRQLRNVPKDPTALIFRTKKLKKRSSSWNSLTLILH